jgi:hypothetical protein
VEDELLSLTCLHAWSALDLCLLAFSPCQNPCSLAPAPLLLQDYSDICIAHIVGLVAHRDVLVNPFRSSKTGVRLCGACHWPRFIGITGQNAWVKMHP